MKDSEQSNLINEFSAGIPVINYAQAGDTFTLTVARARLF